ncbi:MAG: Ldh family oxidoreductase [Chloroflexi bacterium]|nr:Ldh family oxidoreductase [Chloroflexota bacterium]
MLEQFHVPEDIAVRVLQQDMRSTVEDIFMKMGMAQTDARQSADALMYADIRGIESHGVSNMMRSYVEGFGKGSINPRPNWRVIRESASGATIDCDRGLGLAVGPQAMKIAIEKAGRSGAGVVTCTNGRHFGAAAYHAQIALRHDMIGMAMTVGGNRVVPTFGAKPMIGLNPIAFAAPTRKEPPFVFDASTSSVAGNKIALAKRLGVPAMPGWIAEPDGTPIMDTRPIPEDYLMLPLGATREIGSHKGYGLSVMVDILCGVLSGTGPGFKNRGKASHFFMAIKVAAFTDLAKFKSDMDDFMEGLRETPPAPGHERVVYAGLPEHEAEMDRSVNGIPYHPEVIAWFKGTVAELRLRDRLPEARTKRG